LTFITLIKKGVAFNYSWVLCVCGVV